MNHYKTIERAIVYIEKHAFEQPGLNDIARHVGLSEFHFQKQFKHWAGISPKRYLQYLTAQRSGRLLRDANTTLDAALDTGLSGSNRLHDLMVNVFAMTPETYRKQGQFIQVEYGWHMTPFGVCLIGLTDKGVCWLSFHDDYTGLEELKTEWRAAAFVENSEATEQVVKQVFTGVYEKPQTIMLHIKGTNLQIRVWEALLNIPPAQFATYSQIAEHVEYPKAVRAVASAVGRNPVSYVIPCHRVIRKSGALGGYRWGLPRKQVLQAWECAYEIDRNANGADVVNRD